MKKLYFIRTNAYDMVVSVDEEKNCLYLTENEEFPYIDEELEKEEQIKQATEFLKNVVEDDSSWENDCSYQQLFEDSSIEILVEIEKDL